ncbi:MAG: hypothetical protein ACFFFG_10605 [Candidatus Thorarchaeota archaeon]
MTKPISSGIYCENCHTEVEKDSLFCPVCNVRFSRGIYSVYDRFIDKEALVDYLKDVPRRFTIRILLLTAIISFFVSLPLMYSLILLSPVFFVIDYIQYIKSNLHLELDLD